MNEPDPRWTSACLAAQLFARDPAGTGIHLKAAPGPIRDRFLATLRAMLPAGTPWRRCPAGIGEDRLLGGLDLGTTLRAAGPVWRRGLLAETNGGVLVLASAERLDVPMAAVLGRAIDAGMLAVERDGWSDCYPARFGLLLLDEGTDDAVPAGLIDRLAFRLDLDGIRCGDTETAPAAPPFPPVMAPHPDPIEAICAVSAALGIASPRAALLTLRVARLAAALNGNGTITEPDLACAAWLVLGHRAVQHPQSLSPMGEAALADAPRQPAGSEQQTPDRDSRRPDGQQGKSFGGDTPASDVPGPDSSELDRPGRPTAEQDPGGRAEGASQGHAAAAQAQADGALSDIRPDEPDAHGTNTVLAAVQAILPAGLLAATGGHRQASRATGRAQGMARAAGRGRPAGTRPGRPSSAHRLHLVATLRAAAPWQRMRPRSVAGCLTIRASDLRIVRYRASPRVTTIFVVDASGSAALHRLAEAKGAVELLLADCYRHRGEVALLAFRGAQANLLLPPTSALARARRCLGELPGGGGTPLAAGLDAAAELALQLRRRGDHPHLVVLTDGQANIARNGAVDRRRAAADALASGERIAAASLSALVIDISPRPRREAAGLAAVMRARCLALPYADAAALNRAVRAA